MGLRFKLRYSVLQTTDGCGQTRHAFGLTDQSGLSFGIATVQDFIGIHIYADDLQLFAGNGVTVHSSNTVATVLTGMSTATDYYIEISRDGDDFEMKAFSDSTYSTQVGSTANITKTGISALIQICWQKRNNVGVCPAATDTGYIEDIKIYNGVTSVVVHSASNAVADDESTTRWQSTSENNPAIHIDTGSAQEVPMLAIMIDRTNTTETEFEIYGSTDETFTTTELIRTLLVSDFTNNTWRFISLPRRNEDLRYFQLRGKSNTVIFAIAEIQYKAVTDFDRKHYHKYLDPTSTSANSEDSNA